MNTTTVSSAPAVRLVRHALNLPGMDPAFTPKREGPIVGIDLGTTNSCVAFVDKGKPVIIKSRDGYATMPSIVALAADGRLMVGHAAAAQMVTNPADTIHGGKRLVGRPFDSSVVAEVKARAHYQIVAGPSGQAAVWLGGVGLTLEEVSALILKEMKDTAEARLKTPVHRAIITCPAFYSEHQRAAVREAGRLAGLHVERVLNEPTAAALAFGYGKALKKKKLAVFDLGGGTFDATVLDVDGQTFEVKSTGGDTFLGGLDFDHAIVAFFIDTFNTQHGVAFQGDSVALQRLVVEAEHAKRALSEYTTYKGHVPHVIIKDGKPYDLNYELTREKLDALVVPLVDRSLAVLDQVLKEPGLTPADIDDVLLVGGATRMLCVRERLLAYFGKAPHKGVHPDEAVAVGAAILAHAIEAREGIRLIDVNPMSIGVGLPAGRYKKVVERNTALPVSKSYTLATTKDKQTKLELQIFQGEADTTEKNELLCNLGFDELPKKPRGEVKVQVNFHVSDEAILTLTALELTTGREVKTTIATKGTPAVVLRRLHTRGGVQGTGSAANDGGFVAWLKRLFGRD
ncbi:MAG: TIGR02266 family protein [Deltaproteobacteria bacterium]|nr:TIGR02266 family protein [Deltaproteobacteria bacterium]